MGAVSSRAEEASVWMQKALGRLCWGFCAPLWFLPLNIVTEVDGLLADTQVGSAQSNQVLTTAGVAALHESKVYPHECQEGRERN